MPAGERTAAAYETPTPLARWPSSAPLSKASCAGPDDAGYPQSLTTSRLTPLSAWLGSTNATSAHEPESRAGTKEIHLTARTLAGWWIAARRPAEPTASGWGRAHEKHGEWGATDECGFTAAATPALRNLVSDPNVGIRAALRRGLSELRPLPGPHRATGDERRRSHSSVWAIGR